MSHGSPPRMKIAGLFSGEYREGCCDAPLHNVPFLTSVPPCSAVDGPCSPEERVRADIPLIRVIGPFGDELPPDGLHDAPALWARLQEFVEKHAADQAGAGGTP